MMRPRSLQWRISLWLGLGISMLWAIAALVTASQLSREMNVVFDSALEETAQRILPLAVLDITERESDDEMNQRMATLRKHDEYFTYVVRNTAGEVLLQSHSADLSIFPPFTTMGFRPHPPTASISMQPCRVRSILRLPSRWARGVAWRCRFCGDWPCRLASSYH